MIRFKVKLCIVGRSHTKAKVEVPMKLLDEIYVYNELLDYEGVNQLFEKINNRVIISYTKVLEKFR